MTQLVQCLLIQQKGVAVAGGGPRRARGSCRLGIRRNRTITPFLPPAQPLLVSAHRVTESDKESKVGSCRALSSFVLYLVVSAMATASLKTTVPSYLRLPLKRQPLACVENIVHSEQPPRKRHCRQARARICATKTGLFPNAVLPGSPQSQDTPTLSRLAASGEHSMGWFSVLPPELLQMVMNMLDTISLDVLSGVSKDMNSAVCSYLQSGFALKRLLPLEGNVENRHKPDPSDFRNTGTVLRKATVLHTLHRKLKMASMVVDKLETMCQSRNNSILVRHYECFGQLFSSYILNWSELEKAKLFCLVVKVFKLEQKVNRILRFVPGALPWHEWNLRQIFRLLFLYNRSQSEKDYTFWLTHILKSHPIVHQARLLFILTGPVDAAGFISWSSVCGCNYLSSGGGHMKVDLIELATSLRLLLTSRPEDWSVDAIISVIDELTAMPYGWCFEKLACLLMLSGTVVSKAVLGSKAINGRVEELSVMSYYLATACVEEDSKSSRNTTHYLSWFVELMQYIVRLLPDKIVRKEFVTKLVSSWQDYLTVLFDDGESSNDSESEEIREEFSSSLSCLTQLSISVINLLTDETSDSPPVES